MNETNNRVFEQWLSTPMQPVDDNGFSERVVKQYQRYYLKRKISLVFILLVFALIFVNLFSMSAVVDLLSMGLLQVKQLFATSDISQVFVFDFTTVSIAHSYVNWLKQPLFSMVFISVFVVGILLNTSDNL